MIGFCLAIIFRQVRRVGCTLRITFRRYLLNTNRVRPLGQQGTEFDVAVVVLTCKIRARKRSFNKPVLAISSGGFSRYPGKKAILGKMLLPHFHWVGRCCAPAGATAILSFAKGLAGLLLCWSCSGSFSSRLAQPAVPKT